MNYLQKRRRRWYAVLNVPQDVRAHFGKPKFVQSLKTENEATARGLVGPVVAHWKQLIQVQRGIGGLPAEALVWRDMLSKAKTEGILSGCS